MTERPLPSNPQRPSCLRPLAIGSWLAAAVLALSVLPLAAAEDRKGTPGGETPGKIRFNRDIRPILSDKCFQCHGPDATQRKAKLRLDSSEGRDRAGGIGQPGDRPGESRRERALPADHLAKTPTSACRRPRRGKALSAAEVQKLKTWIEQGAEYRGPLGVHPAGPARCSPRSSTPSWVRNPIDAFVLARLEKEGLAPSPEADQVDPAPPAQPRPDRPAAARSRRSTRSSRIRREDAYETQVERLLDSPHYGERWGRLWLDAARYADSDGYEKDKSRKVYFYRDWVIDALNRDLPYDQFIIEQIAGDLLPGADAGPDRGHRLPPQLDDQRGRGHRSRAVPHGGHVRPDGRHRQGHPRADDPVRPVPQPQVRPADPGRVLPDVRLPEQRPRGEHRGLHARTSR